MWRNQEILKAVFHPNLIKGERRIAERWFSSAGQQMDSRVWSCHRNSCTLIFQNCPISFNQETCNVCMLPQVYSLTVCLHGFTSATVQVMHGFVQVCDKKSMYITVCVCVCICGCCVHVCICGVMDVLIGYVHVTVHTYIQS